MILPVVKVADPTVNAKRSDFFGLLHEKVPPFLFFFLGNHRLLPLQTLLRLWELLAFCSLYLVAREGVESGRERTQCGEAVGAFMIKDMQF